MSQIGVVGPLLGLLGPVPAAGEGPLAEALWKPGDLVDVEIFQVFGRGEGMLRVDGRLLRGLFPDHLPQGARLLLRVASSGPPLTLQIPEPPSEPLAALVRPPSQGLASALRAILEAPAASSGSGEAELRAAVRQLLRIPAEPGELARALARWVRSSGMFHEAIESRGSEATDLKGVVLKLLARVPDGEVGNGARAVLGHVEAHQARSLLEGLIVVPLVLPWGDEWVTGELAIGDYAPKDRRKTGGSGRLRMRLDMPNLGPVEVRVRWVKGALGVRLALDPRVLEAARAELGELSESFAAAGLPPVALRIEPLPPRAPRAAHGIVEILA